MSFLFNIRLFLISEYTKVFFSFHVGISPNDTFIHVKFYGGMGICDWLKVDTTVM